MKAGVVIVKRYTLHVEEPIGWPHPLQQPVFGKLYLFIWLLEQRLDHAVKR